ncbi:hypothetical protein B9R53_15030 [Listeria monocytogenes]|nr:hypothetical protein [Listeria monocytogenes]EAF0976872.1 hypothetical protein [Listeria monocytogenes]EAF2422713.1 hypothetical protein [Listeria monocytogenes]EAG4028509.1 hypothetical protein [Listeria monocytogenes]EAG4040963.1 hypothetical protein [Listeria monocytogenes]
MRSELVKKLELAKINTSFIDYGHDGFNRTKHHSYNSALVDAIRIVKTHEAQQMKEPFYQLDEEQENLLNELQIVSREIKCLDLDEVLDKCYHKRLVNEQLAILWESLDVIPKNQVFNAFTTWAIEQKK